jgi:hypothetical protein
MIATGNFVELLWKRKIKERENDKYEKNCKRIKNSGREFIN